MPSSITRTRLRLAATAAIAIALAAGAAGGAYALAGRTSSDDPKPGAVLAATAAPPATATTVSGPPPAAATTIDVAATWIAEATKLAQPHAAAAIPNDQQSASTDTTAPAPILTAPTASNEVLAGAATPPVPPPAPTRTPRPDNTAVAAADTPVPSPTSTAAATPVPALTTYNMGVRNPDSTCCDGADIGETFTLQAYIKPRCDGPCAGPVAWQAAEWRLTFNSPTITLISASPILPGCTSEVDGAAAVNITCGDEQQTTSHTGYTFTLVFRCDQPGLMIYAPQSAGTRVLVDDEWRPAYLDTVKDFNTRRCGPPPTPTP